MVWEAAKTATFHVGLGVAVALGMVAIAAIATGVWGAIDRMARRMKSWQVGGILIVAVVAVVWVSVFVGTLYSGSR